MNLKDFLELRNRYFGKDSLILLLFAFLYTFVLLVLAVFLFNKFSLNNQLAGYSGLFRIFIYPFIILLFLCLYNFGLYCLNIAIRLPYYKDKLIIEKGKFTPRTLINLFNFQGVVIDKYKGDKCIYLTSSYEGMLTKKVFCDCSIKFRAKIVDNGFAVIINAQDFGNYFMLRVGSDDNGLWITPHVRKDGIWEIQSLKSEVTNKVDVEKDSILNFEIIIFRKEAITLTILKDTEIIKKFDYILPTHFPLLPENSSDKLTPKNIVTPIKWPRYGKIGFRAHGEDEKAIIYSLSIEEI